MVEELLWLLFLPSPVRGRVGGCGSRQEGEAPHPKLEKQWPGALVQVPAFASPAPSLPQSGATLFSLRSLGPSPGPGASAWTAVFPGVGGGVPVAGPPTPISPSPLLQHR